MASYAISSSLSPFSYRVIKKYNCIDKDTEHHLLLSTHCTKTQWPSTNGTVCLVKDDRNGKHEGKHHVHPMPASRQQYQYMYMYQITERERVLTEWDTIANFVQTHTKQPTYIISMLPTSPRTVSM